MKLKYILILPMLFVCCLLFSAKAYAATTSDIQIQVTSPVDGLTSESGVVAVEQFPAEIPINITASTGTLTEIKLSYKDGWRLIPPDYVLAIESKERCGPYTITAKTSEGAVMTITVNVVFQVKAIYDVRYRTVGMNVTEIYEGETLLKSFPVPQRIKLINANTVAESEQERIAGWIGRKDGGTYTLKGSLVVEIHNAATGQIYGVYDTKTNFEELTTRYGWTQKALVAFETMRDTELTYQAPVQIDIDATWCDKNKKEIYGTLTAQDKGIPELLYPYQTTSVTFCKDDIALSRNFKYLGLEWIYTPESADYTNGEGTQTQITQKIHYQTPAADFYFKFQPTEGNDLSVAIQAPLTVERGTDYSFSVIYMNSGKSSAFDAPLQGTVDDVKITEIPAKQDFSPNESKTYTVKRTADTTADEIHLWANIGVPEGFVDGNLSNNTATAVIRIVDPEPETTGDYPDIPDDPDDPDIPDDPDDPDTPPDQKEKCDLMADILAAPTVFEGETYSFTVTFTNQSSLKLQGVSLSGKNNDNPLSQIPKKEDFAGNETKTYTITGTAGHVGEVYNLWVHVDEPKEFADENPVNNTAISSITVVEKPDNRDDPDNPDNPDNPDDPDNPNDPDTPDDPGHPDNPDDIGPPIPPPNRTCDVWTNLSTPPTVYEQEDYKFTVYFANSSSQPLSDVCLQVKINGHSISTLPATANFKAYEKKSYALTATAGAYGAPIKITATVLPPNGYTDSNPGNNEVLATIMVLEKPYDLDVQKITPDHYKENQSVVTVIKVGNKGSVDFTPGKNVTVLFQIPELSYEKRMDAVVMEKDTWNVVSVCWNTPNVQVDQTISMIATINPDKSLNNESTADNNVYKQKAVIENVAYEEPEESRSLPEPPQRKEQPRVTWWEQRYENGRFVWHEYYAELKVNATLEYATKNKEYLKSGYGYSIKVSAAVNTNYDRPELIIAPQTAEVYLPEYRYDTAIPLIKSDGKFVFKENPTSPFKYRKQYVPLWFPDDKDYIVQLLVADAHTPGGSLSRWITGGQLAIHIMDSMYSDDVTGGDR